MAIEVAKYQVDFTDLIERDQQGNAIDESLDIFKDKAVYEAVLTAFIDETNELYREIVGLSKARTIAYGSGYWLDGLGAIVGQAKEYMPSTAPNVFFVWDSDTYTMDNSLSWITGVPEGGSYSSPTDNDYRDQIVRRVFQNMNENSSIPEIQSAVKAVLGIDIKIEQTGVRTIKLYVPAGTPSWMTFLLTGKTFSYTDGGYNRWYFPFPATCIIDETIGEY